MRETNARMRIVQAGRFRVALAILAVTALTRLGIAAPTPIASQATAAAGRAAVAPGRASDHVGEQVTIEGRVFAVHASPTATVLAFAPNFAGFTATILAADRAKFPSDVDHYRDKLVRVSGTVSTYRGKPEMALRDPSQLVLVDRPGESPSPGSRVVNVPGAVATPDGEDLRLREELAAMSERLDAIEARLAAIERSLAALAASAAEPRMPSLAIGTPAVTVRAALGEPPQITRGARGEAVWVYDGGRTITFDATGRVVSWTGF